MAIGSWLQTSALSCGNSTYRRLAMTDYTQVGKEMADRLFSKQGWSIEVQRLCNELGELRARLDALEAKYSQETRND
jgi:hypothetical protein